MINLNCPCRLSYSNKEIIRCKICGYYQHKDCLKDLLKMLNYECPACQLNSLDPFVKVVKNILSPIIIPFNPIYSSVRTTFVLLPEISMQLNEPNLENKKYLLIRCLRIDPIGFEHHWPMNSSIILNGKIIKTFIYPKELNRSAQRKDFPIVFYSSPDDVSDKNNYHGFNRSHMLPLSDYIEPNKMNQLELKNEVCKNSKDVYTYVISIDLVEVLRRVEDVLLKIPIVNDLNTLARRQNYLGSIRNDLRIENENISFLDCYMQNGTRIQMPARSIECHHLKVFDLKNYLLMRRNKNYNCPICKSKAIRVFIDGFVKSLLESQVYKDKLGVVLSCDYVVMDDDVRENCNYNSNKMIYKDTNDSDKIITIDDSLKNKIDYKNPKGNSLENNPASIDLTEFSDINDCSILINNNNNNNNNNYSNIKNEGIIDDVPIKKNEIKNKFKEIIDLRDNETYLDINSHDDYTGFASSGVNCTIDLDSVQTPCDNNFNSYKSKANRNEKNLILLSKKKESKKVFIIKKVDVKEAITNGNNYHISFANLVKSNLNKLRYFKIFEFLQKKTERLEKI